MKTKQQKQQEAEARAKARASRTPEQQLRHLDSILGKDKGAKKERTKLTKQLNELQRS